MRNKNKLGKTIILLQIIEISKRFPRIQNSFTECTA